MWGSRSRSFEISPSQYAFKITEIEMVPGSASGSSLRGLANDHHSPIHPFCEPRNVLFPVRPQAFPSLWPSDGDDVSCERVVPLRSRTDKVGKALSEATPPHAVRFVSWIFWHPDLPTVQPPRPRLDIEIPTPGLLFRLGRDRTHEAYRVHLSSFL